MKGTKLEKWAEQSDEHARIYAQEGLILDVTEAIWEQMDKAGLKKKDLAKMLGKSPAYITQLLNGSRNMTLRTLSDIAYAMNIEPKFHFGKEGGFYSQQIVFVDLEPFEKEPVIVAGQEDQWTEAQKISNKPRLRAVA
jgi:transcriptional regulator with XRE-family HTH domain